MAKQTQDSKSPPNFDPSQFFAALKRESERGQVILLTSQIDDLLKQILKAHLKPHRGKEDDDDKLFRLMGPLSSFSSHIEVAYRLGLISKASADCFDLLRDIRNDCAHQTEPFSYQKGSHSQKFENVKTLTFQLSGMAKFYETVERVSVAVGFNTKEPFLFVIAIVHILALETTLLRLKPVADSFIGLENIDVWPSFLKA